MDNNAILEMLIEQKELIKSLDKKISTPNTSSQQVDVERVAHLASQMQTSITKIDGVVEHARQPIVKQHKLTIDIVSKSIIFIFIGMVVIISALSSGLYLAQQPNYDRIDNDLKYRYIKMKGSASPKQIAELEDIFELNRDKTKIRQMLKDVKLYEETIHKRSIAQEQKNLRQLELDQLTTESESIKNR